MERLKDSGIKAPSLRLLQEWRRLGHIPYVVERLGYGRTRSFYTPDALDRAEEVARALHSLEKMSIVTLGLFGIGRTAKEKALRSAYRWVFDRDESFGVGLLTAAREGASSYTKLVYRATSSMRREVPAAVDELNRLAKEAAAEESQELDLATGKPTRFTSREIRERWFADIAALLIDPATVEGGYEHFLIAMGIEEDAIGATEDLGGAPSIAEMRDAIERSTFEELLEARDALRAGFRSQVALMPSSPILTFVLTTFDEPRTGFELACALASTLALVHRGEQAGAGEA